MKKLWDRLVESSNNWAQGFDFPHNWRPTLLQIRDSIANTTTGITNQNNNNNQKDTKPPIPANNTITNDATKENSGSSSIDTSANSASGEFLLPQTQPETLAKPLKAPVSTIVNKAVPSSPVRSRCRSPPPISEPLTTTTNTNTTTTNTNTDQPMTPEGGPITAKLYDCCAHVIVCPAHQMVLLSVQSGYTWLPFTPLPLNQNWNEGALFSAALVLSMDQADRFRAMRANQPFLKTAILEVVRVQDAQSGAFTTRLVYYTKLNPNTSNTAFRCCQNAPGRLQWTPLADVFAGRVDHLWGPEVLDLTRWHVCPFPQRVIDLGRDQILVFNPRRVPPRNQEEAMLRAAKLEEADVHRLYQDFVEHCFPALAGMTVWSLKHYLTRNGLLFPAETPFDDAAQRRLVRLFHAFNYHRNGYLSFHEFLLGLAAIDPRVPQCEGRVKLLFRYYDKGGKGYLAEEDFRRLVADLQPPAKDAKTTTVVEEASDALVAEALKLVRVDKYGDKFGVTYGEFHRVMMPQPVASFSAVFKNAPNLVRAKRSAFIVLLDRALQEAKVKGGGGKGIMACAEAEKRHKKWSHFLRHNHRHAGRCVRCTENRRYTLFPHITHWSPSTGSSTTTVLVMRGNKHLSATTTAPTLDAYLTPTNAGTQLLHLIRAFNDNTDRKGTVYHPKGLLMNDVPRLLSLFTAVHGQLLSLLDSGEGKCVSLDSPCAVVGDIHGNLSDLMSMARTIWHRLPFGSNLLFLGDYVDRGRWGVECALYVFALKAVFPHKVTLLRGNHEVRIIQEKYSFLDECIVKYQEPMGRRMWDMLNQVFDRLPIAATVDDAIFAVHGGIPRDPAATLADIARQPLDIRAPELDDDLVWEMLWSDPIEREPFVAACDFHQEEPDSGFLHNYKRGAGYWFSQEAAFRFLARNGLTHLFRAHEVPAKGVAVNFEEMRCATVFSCSHYCGADNLCAVLYVQNERIRIVLVDTQTNEGAMNLKGL